MLDFILLSAVMMVNAIAFIPQAVKIFRLKSSSGVSPSTYIIFLLMQAYLVFHSYFYDQDYVLAIGYFASMFTCGSVLALTLYFRDKEYFPELPVQIGQAMAQIPGHVYMKDLTGKCLWCNTSNWKSFGGVSLKDFIGNNNDDLFDEKSAKLMTEIDNKVITTGKAVVAEEKVIFNGVEYLYLSVKMPLKNAAGEVVGLVGNSIDITEAKKEVLEKLNLLENIIAAMPGYVYWMNQDGVYLGCNELEAKAIGLESVKDIVGKRNVDMPGFLIAEELDPVNERVMATGEAITLEEPVEFPDKTQGVFISSKTPLRNIDDEVVGMLGVSIDITEQKKLEKKLVVAKDKAEVANRAKEQFLYNMRHDIRTPFAGIMGVATLLQRIEHDETKRQYIESIYSSAEHLLDYLNEILELTQIGGGDLPVAHQMVALQQVAQNCIDMYVPALQENKLSFSFSCDPLLPEFLVTDEFRLKRIIINLLGNAIKFTPEGFVKLTIKFIEGEENSEDVTVMLSVQDSGIGIPEDKQNIIFEKFERLSASYEGKYKGSGLGLFAVKTLVADLGGKVSLKSREAEGSTFTCTIPMRKPDEQELKERAAVIADMSDKVSDDPGVLFQSPLSVLLIEDDAVAQLVASSILEDLGAKVDVVSSGEQALSFFNHHDYDLILMDIGLPGASGYEVSKNIRSSKKGRKSCVVALTAHAKEEVLEKCYEVGINDVISKPLTREKSLELIERIQENKVIKPVSDDV